MTADPIPHDDRDLVAEPVTTAPHAADHPCERLAMLRLDAFHLEAIRLGAGAATLLGMPAARDAATARHELWTAALLVHEAATNPLWQVGRPRSARTVATALAAARRLTEAALATLTVAAKMPMEHEPRLSRTWLTAR